MFSKHKSLFVFVIIFFYFLLHLFIINDYGLSWDFHFHFYGGLYHLGLPVPSPDKPSDIPFTSPDPRLTVTDPFGPFISVIPTLSYLLFYEKLHILPFDSAYNFASVIFGVIGIAILFLFIWEFLGFGEAIAASLFLAVLPTYFGYLHYNMKDVPNAVVFAAAVYLFARFTKRKSFKTMFWAVLSFAFAFNWKINSAVIPVIGAIWSIWMYSCGYIKKKMKLFILYFVLSPLVAVAVWWPFWKDPIGKLLEIPALFSHNTYNMPVLLFGQIFRSGINIPWYYPFLYIGITTPVPILISFAAGLLICFKKINAKDGFFLLLLMWFFVPLVRYFTVQNAAIDGMRHFLEVVFPLSAISGVGAVWALNRIGKFFGKKTVIFVSGFVILLLLFPLVKYHPYETNYFNFLTGGIKGAQGKFDIDFWGNPQKEAVLWLNKNAPYGSTVNVVMAQSTAAVYLREDLLRNLNTKNISGSDYVLLLNRQSFFTNDINEYLSPENPKKKPVFSKTIDGVPLVWIFTAR